MKKWLPYILAAFFAVAFAIPARAQEDVWEKVKEVNLPGQYLQAAWSRIYHSPMLQEDLLSEGTVVLRQPGYLRWETLKPVPQVTELDRTQGKGRFRFPEEKDFQVTVLESETCSVQLIPLRRDLKQLVGQIILTVEKKSYKLLNVTILGVNGEWTQITFSDVRMDK